MSVLSLKAFVRQNFAVLVMTLAVLLSSIAVVYSKHQSRVEFVALQKLEQRRDYLDEEWGRLLLEQSTWSELGRIEREATQQLNMIGPPADKIVVVRQ
jgi:cell division protein FtsL